LTSFGTANQSVCFFSVPSVSQAGSANIYVNRTKVNLSMIASSECTHECTLLTRM